MGTRAQEILSQCASLFGGDFGPRGIFRDLVLERDEIAGGCDVGAELFSLLRAIPAECPAPEADASTHELVGFLEAGFALQKSLGVVVVAEAGGNAIGPEDVALVFEKLLCARLRFVAGDTKVDGGFGEGAIKIAGREPDARAEKGEADRDEAVVRRAESLFHGSGFLGGPVQSDATQYVLVGIHQAVAVLAQERR